jgi:hypothetical protein
MKRRDARQQFEVHIAGVKSSTKLCDLTVGQFVQLVSQLSRQSATKMPDKETLRLALDNVREVISEQKGQAKEFKEIVNSARSAVLDNLGRIVVKPTGDARDAGASPYGRG